MEVKVGYKQTEIGVIPEDWEVKELGNIGEVKMCRRIFSHQTSTNGSIPFYKIGTFGKVADAYISKDLYVDFRQKFSFPTKGDILISAAGTIGRTIIYNGEDAYFQDSNIVWINNKQTIISNEYLYHILQVVKYNTEGGTIQRLYNSILKATKFICPTEDEQTAIANALSDTDTWINSLEELLTKKRQIKQGAMQELLQPKEGWEVKKLGEVSKIYTGKKNNQDKIENGIYPFFVRSQTIERINSYSFDGEAILIPGEGNIGKIFHYINGKFDFHQRVYKISNFSSGFFGKYIYRYISEFFGKHAMENSVKATVDSLRLPTFENFEIPFPPTLEEQTRIANILSDMDDEIAQLETKLAKAKQIKQGMMQELLTGRIRLV